MTLKPCICASAQTFIATDKQIPVLSVKAVWSERNYFLVISAAYKGRVLGVFIYLLIQLRRCSLYFINNTILGAMKHICFFLPSFPTQTFAVKDC